MENKVSAPKIVNVQAYKHNGRLYRQWNGVKVIESSPDAFVLFMFKTKVAEDDGQKWIVREPTLWFMPRKSFFNTTGLIRRSGTYFYTNISSPPIYEDGTIKYIDYDLDIKAYPNMPVKVVDQDEFEKNKVKYKYPDKLVKRIEKTLKEVLENINENEYIYDQDVVDTYIRELVHSKDLSKKFLKFIWD